MMTQCWGVSRNMQNIYKVNAYILKVNAVGYDQLLALGLRDQKHLPFELPGATFLEEDSHFDDKWMISFLETCIHDQCGSLTLEMFDKLGEVIQEKPETGQRIFRHSYVVRVASSSTDEQHWDHQSYECFWLDSSHILYLHPDFHSFLTIDYIPSLFRKDDMLGLQQNENLLTPYHPKWKEMFLKEKHHLLIHLSEEARHIEHIGSTSVPGMIAKPIIDIGIAVQNDIQVTKVVERLERYDFISHGDMDDYRGYFFQKYEEDEAQDQRVTYRVHVFRRNDQRWLDHLMFREHLIDQPVIANKYAKIKWYVWRKRGHNQDLYDQEKGVFITSVLKHLNMQRNLLQS